MTDQRDTPTPPSDEAPPPPPPGPAPAGHLTADEIVFINRLLDRSEKAYTTFKVELWLYNALGVAALIVVVFIAFKTLQDPKGGWQAWAGLLGSGGIFATAGILITRFLDKQTDLLSKVIDSFFALVKPS